jgi:hypothetical protein
MRLAFPSGRAWAHSRFCPERPGRKLELEERAELGLAPLSGDRARVRILTPAECDRLEPVGELALIAWLAHPAACRCFACGYTTEHLDDETEAEL